MKKILYFSILMILFSSCYTVKRMNNQVVKGYNTYPIEFNETISKLLPVKETTIRTVDTIYKEGVTSTDTVFTQADCDTVKVNSQGKKIVYIPGKLRVDTFMVTIKDSTTVKDIREIKAYEDRFNKSQILIGQKDTKISILTWTSSILGIILLAFLALKFIFKIF